MSDPSSHEWGPCSRQKNAKSLFHSEGSRRSCRRSRQIHDISVSPHQILGQTHVNSCSYSTVSTSPVLALSGYCTASSLRQKNFMIAPYTRLSINVMPAVSLCPRGLNDPTTAVRTGVLKTPSGHSIFSPEALDELWPQLLWPRLLDRHGTPVLS